LKESQQTSVVVLSLAGFHKKHVQSASEGCTPI
jgi:hypothetical protein